MINLRKCAVVGVGFVGATAAFTLATSGLFSEIILLDANQKKAEGEAADISHGIAFAQPCTVRAGAYADLGGCGLIVIAAGANQKPGEGRTELLSRNRAILQSILEHILPVNSEAIFLIVSNPVDLLTYMTHKLSGLPPQQVIGSGTVLDSARLKHLLGQYLQVDSRNVHAFIIGEHGDSELAVWSSANISGVDLNDYCRIFDRDATSDALHRIYLSVRDAAYAIIENKGATYYGIGLAVRRIAEAIVRDEHSVLPVSTLVAGHYGISDLCLGLPCVIGSTGVQHVLDIPLNDEESTQLRASAQKMRDLLTQIGL